MRWIAGKAFAKINLGLYVLDRRADGYHELRTVFQTISLADELEVGWEPGERTAISIECDVAELAGPENLAAKAAAELLGRLGRTGQVEIRLRKRIPHGAGLGGGSADAAGVLLALEKLLGADCDPREVYSAACALGSDVPFFLLGGTAVGVGRGEEVAPLPDGPPRPVVVLAPREKVSTPEAYRALAEARGGALTSDRKRNTLKEFWAGIRASTGAPNQGLGELGNDFEGVVFLERPSLKQLKDRLRAAGATHALLSGSGSALFGIYATDQAAERAVEELAGFDGSVRLERTVNRQTCKDAWSEVRE